MKTAEAEDRLDRWLAANLPGWSRRRLEELFRAGRVKVNGRRAKKGFRLKPGDIVVVKGVPGEPAPLAIEAEVEVIYEDGSVTVVNKPAGMPTHPLSPEETGTLINLTVARWPQTRGVGPHMLEPGLLHRLDTKTSGLVLLALSPLAFRQLHLDLQRGRVKRFYRALVRGEVSPAEGEISISLARSSVHPGLMVPVIPGARFRGRPFPALTRYRLFESSAGVSLLELELVTGVMHQLRVHLAHLGHPVLGEDRYGPAPETASTAYALQAAKLIFPHPVTGRLTEVSSPRLLSLADADKWLLPAQGENFLCTDE